MDKVVFLDRDGTLNEEVHYLHRIKDLKLLPGVGEALKSLKDAGFKLVVVTNQAGVARGYYSCEEVETLHGYLNQRLDEWGARIDRFFDVLAGVNYGISGILVGTGYGASLKKEMEEKGEQPLYDFYAETLVDAAEYIIDREQGIRQP